VNIAFLNPKVYHKNPNSGDFMLFLFFFFWGHGKGESVQGSFEIKQLENNDPFEMYFVPNTAYPCDSLQFLPTLLPELIDT
jgi:hypothetical protein